MEIESITIDTNSYKDFLLKDTTDIKSVTVKYSKELELTVDNLNKIFSKIALDGKIIVYIKNEDKEDKIDIKSNLRFSGFSSVKVVEDQGEISITGVKKDTGQKNDINSWKVISQTEPSSKINENDLIDPNNIYQQFAKEQNCMTKPKPCKNCNCGRAQEEQNGKEGSKEGQFVKSDCGRCYLGDAFRCEGCPYRGKPAFEPGQKVTLDLNSDFIQNDSVENNEVKVKSGKVKLDI